MLLFYAIMSLIVLTIAAVATIFDNEVWVSAFCWAVFILNILAIIDSAMSYVNLGDADFRMRKNFRATVIPRDNIESISVAKGCPIRLHLKDGSRVEVPDLGGKGIANSLRAWILAT